MKLLRATQRASVVPLALVLSLGIGFAQTIAGSPVAAASAASLPENIYTIQPARAFPRLTLWDGEVLTYLGVFSPDAVFHTTSKFTGATGHSPGEGVPPADFRNPGQNLSSVPVSMLLSNERVTESFDPPAHAAAIAHASSSAAEIRNRFITFLYGRPSVLSAPRHIATDSLRRLIVSDPDASAVHVLDPAGGDSFRIVTGAGRRLQRPAGVAVDADNNFYIADSQRGMLAVFDQHGNFVRYIGNYKGENEYLSPLGIAIDQMTRRLYLVDSPRNLVFILDLTGKVLKRLGKYHDGTGVGEFDDPTDIAVTRNHVYVLDNSGTRVQILDPDGNLQGSFNLRHGLDQKRNRENGLGVDQQGNIYVSFSGASQIRIYSEEGRLLSSFGQGGSRVGEFVGPKGLWIDSANRLFVADSGNGRVQLFQLHTQP
ncbi:MAG TPA: 6-bladed beta-propeller [Terriglobales bacterium]